MPVDYEAITAENLRRYGTDAGRWGQLILQDRYEDPAHFVYELLQNSEDALRRRGSAWKEREVVFDLNGEGLTVSHFGKRYCSILLGGATPPIVEQ